MQSKALTVAAYKSLEDLPLDAVGEIIAATPVETFIARNEKSRTAASPRGGAAGPSRGRRG